MTTHDQLLLSVVLYGMILTGVLIYVFVARRAHVFEPVFQFIFFYSLFVLPLPLRTLVTLKPIGNVSDQILIFYPFMPAAVLLCTAALVLFVVGYYSPLASRLNEVLPKPADSPQDNPLLGFVVIFAFSVLLVSILAGGRGLLGLILLGYGSSAELFGQGHLAIGFPWSYVASLFLLYGYALTKKRKYLALFALAFGVVTAVHMVMGNRSQVMYFTMAALFFWHFGVRPISRKAIVLWGVSAFLLLNVVGLLRSSNYTDVGSLADRTAAAIQSVGESDDASGFFYTLTTGEFVVPFETLPQMMRRVSDGGDYEWGGTYLKVPLFVIPSVIYPDRPLPLANWYMREFYGTGYGANEGRQFFFLAEAYLNFGVPGVLIFVTLIGIFWGAVGRYVCSGSQGAVLLGALSIAFIFRSIAGDSVSLLVGLTQQCLSAAVIALLISMGKWRWQFGGRRAV